MSLSRYLGGVVTLSVIVASLWTSARRLRSVLVPEWRGPLALLAESIAFLGLLLTGAQLLGAVGLFGRWPLVLASIVTAVAIHALIPASRSTDASRHPWARLRTDGTVRRGVTRRVVVTIALIVIAFIPWLDRSIAGLRSGVLGYDSVSYHMPFAARFSQSASLLDAHFTYPGLDTAFHPQNAELLHGIGMDVFRTDVLSPVVNLMWLSLVLLAAWCVGRPRGLAHGTLAVTTVLVTCPLLLWSNGGKADNDLAGMALFLAAVALLLKGEEEGTALGLAAAAAGMALGVKLTLVAPVGALTVGVLLVARRGHRAAVARTWLPWLFVTGAFWYLRDLLLVGSPLPALGRGDHPSPTVAHYLTDWSVWREWFLPGLGDSFGPLWPVLLGLALIGCVAALVRGERQVRMLGAVAIASLLAYIVTPASALGHEGRPTAFASNLRFALPGLLLAGVLFVIAGPSGSRIRRWEVLGLSVIALVNLGVYLDRSRSISRLAATLVVVLGGLFVAGLVMVVRSERLGRALGPTLLALVVGVGVVVGWRVERSYLDRRYRSAAHSLPNASAPHVEVGAMYKWIPSVKDARIAIAGFGWQYPLFGSDLSNDVQYIGHDASDGRFEAITSCREWRRRLNAGKYDYVVTSANNRKIGHEPREAEWTRNDSAATPIVRAATLTVFRLDGSLDPDACGSDTAGK